MITEKHITTAAKLYQCRDTAKKFFGNKYAEKIRPYTALIQAVMKANGMEEIPALLMIIKTETFQENPMNQMMFFAATLELIEPSADLLNTNPKH